MGCIIPLPPLHLTPFLVMAGVVPRSGTLQIRGSGLWCFVVHENGVTVSEIVAASYRERLRAYPPLPDIALSTVPPAKLRINSMRIMRHLPVSNASWGFAANGRFPLKLRGKIYPAGTPATHLPT